MRYDFVEAFSDIDDELVTDVFPEAQRAVEIKLEQRPSKFGWKKLAAAAACLAAVGTGAAFGIPALKDAISAMSAKERHLELGHYANSSNPAKVFEYYGLNAANCHVSFTMEEYPDMVFDLDEDGVYIKLERGGEYAAMINEDRLKSVYLYDVTGDGKRELCITFEYGSNSRKKNYLKILDLVGDRIYRLFDTSENYVLAGADDMEYTQTLIPNGFAGTEVSEDDLVYFAFGNERSDVKSLKADGGSYGDFEIAASDFLANWDKCNPVRLWKSGDPEKTFSLPQFPNIQIHIGDMALDIIDGGSPVEFTELNYRDRNIVRYNELFSGDIDMDGKCELCVSYTIDQVTDTSVKSDSGIIVYDLDARQSITPSGFLDGKGWELELKNGVLTSYCRGPVVDDDINKENNKDMIVCSPYNHLWIIATRYRQEYERYGKQEETRNFPGELNIRDAMNGEEQVFEIEEFPGESFRVTTDARIIDKNGKVLIDAPRLMNGFLFDVNGDNKRDICVTVEDDGVYYIEVYDVENGDNLYCCGVNPYKESRYLSVMRESGLWVRSIFDGREVYYNSLNTVVCTKVKPTIEKIQLICDCEEMSAGEIYDFSVDEQQYMDLSLVGAENGAALCYKQKILYGTKNVSLLEGVLNIYLYDTNRDGRRELYMTYLDGDRTAVAVMLFDDENTMYFSADDGNQRRLIKENDTLMIVSEPSSGGAAVTETLKLDELIKQD